MMKDVTTALSTWKPASLAEPLPQGAIGEVFRSLKAQLGVKIADLFQGVPFEDVKAEWAARLSGFRRYELERGIEACSNRRFAPTIGEFKQLCRPSLDPEVAWLEAAAGMRARANGNKGEWTHPAVYRAAVAMVHEVRTKNYSDCRRRWEWELQRAFAEGWGDSVPEAVLQIVADIKPGRQPESVRVHIAQILASRKKAESTEGETT